MSSFSSFLEQQGISSERLFWASARVERFSDEDYSLRCARERRRVTKAAGEPLGKPHSGRGASRLQIADAIAGREQPPRVRAKLVRAINTLLGKTGKEPIGHPQLFGEVKARSTRAAPVAAATPPTP